MLARCPHCDTYFRLRADDLSAARGQVQCGNCGTQFSALENLFDNDLDTPLKVGSPPQSVDASSDTVVVQTTSGKEDPPSVQHGSAARWIEEKIPLELRASLADGEWPEFDRKWMVGAALLLILLVGQFIWFRSNAIVTRFPALRAPYKGVCAVLGCEIARQKDITALHILARDVREHPKYARVLLVNATVQNDAAFKQPYPILQLQLFDSTGAPAGGRRFTPSEYLDGSVDILEGMPPGVPVHIVLELDDPAKKAKGFEIRLL